MQHRHPTFPHGGAGLRDGLRLRSKLVEQRDHGGLIGARIRRVIRGARVVGGVANLVTTVALHNTERTVLHHDSPMARVSPWLSHREGADGSQGPQGFLVPRYPSQDASPLYGKRRDTRPFF